MASPFQQLLKEFEDFDGADVEHIAIVVLAMLLGAVIGMVVSRRRQSDLQPLQALWRATFIGITFPLVTFVTLFVIRLTPYGLATGALPQFAVRVFASLVVIRIIARVLRRLFPDSAPARNTINVVSVLIWFGLVMHLAGVLPVIEHELDTVFIPLGKTQVSALTLLQGLGLVGFTLLAALWLSSLLESRLMATGIDMSLRLVLSRFMRATLFVLALLIALAAVGIDLTVLSVFGGALGVGLGLGLQKIAANYVSGFAMLLERSFRVGDIVKIDTFEGQITHIHTRYTVVRAPNGRESVVPNEMFIVNRVENLSLESKSVAFNTALQIDYSSDVERARALMIEAALAHKRVLKEPKPGVLLTNFAPDGLELTLGYWITDPENGIGNVRSDINLAIWKAFQSEGISVPFPQRVVRVVNDAGADQATVNAAAAGA